MAILPIIKHKIDYNLIFNNLCLLLENNDKIIKQFSKQDYYLYCLYFPVFFNKEFIDNELVYTAKSKLSIKNSFYYDINIYNIYRNNFTYCFKQLLYFERTLYDLLFTVYNKFIKEHLNIIYYINNTYINEFLQRNKFFDILYQLLPIVYNKYGNDYWNRAQIKTMDLFIYFMYFEPYFTDQMFTILSSKLLRYFNKLHPSSIQFNYIKIIKQYINDSNCSKEWKDAFNSKYLLAGL